MDHPAQQEGESICGRIAVVVQNTLTEGDEVPGGGGHAPDKGDGQEDGGVVGLRPPEPHEQHQAQVEQEGSSWGRKSKGGKGLLGMLILLMGWLKRGGEAEMGDNRGRDVDLVILPPPLPPSHPPSHLRLREKEGGRKGRLLLWSRPDKLGAAFSRTRVLPIQVPLLFFPLPS